MMEFILSILVNALIVLAVSYILPKVEVRNFKSALIVAIIIAILSPTLGALLTFLLGVGTLGLFWIVGICRIIANAIVLKAADALVGGFKIHGFLNAIIAAILMALLAWAADGLLDTGPAFKELF